MCKWIIIPQVHKVRGEETEVLVKPVSYYPIEDAKGHVVDFGRLSSTFMRILFNAENPIDPNSHWKLTLSMKNGKINLTPPKRLMPATQVSEPYYVDADYMGSPRKSSGQMTSEEMQREMERNNFPADFVRETLALLVSEGADFKANADLAKAEKAAYKLLMVAKKQEKIDARNAKIANREAKKAEREATKATNETDKAERRHQRELKKAEREAVKAAKIAERERKQAELTIAERNRKDNPFIPSRKALGLIESDPIARAKAEGLALMQAAQAEEAAAKNKPVKASTSKKKSKKTSKKKKKAA